MCHLSLDRARWHQFFFLSLLSRFSLVSSGTMPHPPPPQAPHLPFSITLPTPSFGLLPLPHPSPPPTHPLLLPQLWLLTAANWAASREVLTSSVLHYQPYSGLLCRLGHSEWCLPSPAMTPPLLGWTQEKRVQC